MQTRTYFHTYTCALQVKIGCHTYVETNSVPLTLKPPNDQKSLWERSLWCNQYMEARLHGWDQANVITRTFNGLHHVVFKVLLFVGVGQGGGGISVKNGPESPQESVCKQSSLWWLTARVLGVCQLHRSTGGHPTRPPTTAAKTIVSRKAHCAKHACWGSGEFKCNKTYLDNEELKQDHQKGGRWQKKDEYFEISNTCVFRRQLTLIRQRILQGWQWHLPLFFPP